jgi:hypothetical protein
MSIANVKELYEYIWDIYCEVYEDVSCPKFCGTFTAEEIRRRLLRHGLPVSQQDVFIRNIPIEIDLVIPRPNAKARLHGLVYKPEDVLAVLEIKYRGTFSGDAIGRIRENFRTIQLANKSISCFYLTVTETLGYKNAVTREKLGYPAYTLYWYAKGKHKKTNDWNKLVTQLKKKLDVSHHGAN